MAVEHAQHHPTPHDEDPATEHTRHPNYVSICVILLVLLVISILGPELGIRAVTLITAFGIAVVKAYLVAKNFMHLTIAPRFVVYLCGDLPGLHAALLRRGGARRDEGAGHELGEALLARQRAR